MTVHAKLIMTIDYPCQFSTDGDDFEKKATVRIDAGAVILTRYDGDGEKMETCYLTVRNIILFHRFNTRDCGITMPHSFWGDEYNIRFQSKADADGFIEALLADL